jgi:hypothetical protein
VELYRGHALWHARPGVRSGSVVISFFAAFVQAFAFDQRKPAARIRKDVLGKRCLGLNHSAAIRTGRHLRQDLWLERGRARGDE